ncbi:hypothetical protein L218DRAFT_875877, partial [Marasmius fiardii PR-910]
QTCWTEKMAEFDFQVQYVSGSENVLADALSHIYSNEQHRTVWLRSEYMYHDVINNDILITRKITMLLPVSIEASCLVLELFCDETS